MSDGSENDPEFNAPIQRSSRKTGCAPYQILLVLAVPVLLVMLLLPAVRTAGPAARRAQCTNNLKQIALALSTYEQIHKMLPPAYTVDAGGRPLHSWRTLILPYLESESSLYKTIDLSKPWDDPANRVAREAIVPTYQCPERKEPLNTTTYLAIVGPVGCLIPGTPRRLVEITDPHAMTLMVIEAGEEQSVPWMAPLDANESLVLGLEPKSKLLHTGGMNAAMVDGSVRFLKAALCRWLILLISCLLAWT